MLEAFLSEIFRLQPTQEKKVGQLFRDQPQAKTDLALFLKHYTPLIESERVGGLEGLAAAYNQMLDELVACRLHFIREGCYPLQSAEDAFDRVYNNEQQMWPYMLGLAVSQYLWPTHYALLQFYKQAIRQADPAGRFLEIGCGPGIFINELTGVTEETATIDVVDISPVSIALSKELLQLVKPEILQRIRFIQSDIVDYDEATPYNFIGMGEVLEHVEDPLAVLKSLHRLLHDDGRLYISTCANCPTIDHIYLYHNVEEIRLMIEEAGFHIAKEAVLPSEDKPMEYMEQHKLDIVYGALLVKQENNR